MTVSILQYRYKALIIRCCRESRVECVYLLIYTLKNIYKKLCVINGSFCLKVKY